MSLKKWFRIMSQVFAVPNRRRASLSRRRATMRFETLEDRTTPATLSNFLTVEHVDIEVGYSGGPAGEWSISAHDDENEIEHEADDAVLYVAANAQSMRTPTDGLGFVGVASGESYFHLPQSQDPDRLYLGFAAFSSTDFDEYDVTTESGGRSSGQGRWLKVSLVDVAHSNPDGTAGTGKFSVWQDDISGPISFMASSDGIAAGDALWLTAGGHLHYNFGFSQAGRYEVSVKASGYYIPDGGVNPTMQEGTFTESDPITIYFSVNSVGQVQFGSATTLVNEQAGYRTIAVNRVGGSDGELKVNYATSDGTATVADGDYVASSGTLTFADGETTKVITVQVANAGIDVGNETFNLTLSAPPSASPGDTGYLNAYLLDVTSDDLLGTNATTAVTINDTPTITPIVAQTTTIGTATAPIAFTVGDAETAAGSITLSATSSNPQLVPVSNIAFGGSGASRTVTVTPVAGLSGSSRIYIIATDENGAEITANFTLQVGNATALTAIAIDGSTPANSVPNVTLGADDSFTLNYTVTNSAWVTNVTFVELDNTNLINSHGTGSTSDLRTQPGTSGATARSLRIRGRDKSTAAGDYGTANVTLGFTGAGAPTNTHTFNVRVNPRAVADNWLLAIPGTTSTFDVLSNDAVPLSGHTFAITAVSGASNGTLTIAPDGKTLRYTPTNLTTGIDRFTYTVTVSSSDGFNGYSFTGQASVKIGGYVVVDSPTASQHIDLDFDFAGGVWTQKIRTDSSIVGSVESGTFGPSTYDADEGVIFFDPSTKQPRSAAPSLDVLGVPAGADVWFGPTSSSGNKVYLGIANESTTGIDAYTPVGDPRATSNASWVRTDLVGFSGPGHFAALNGSDVAFDTFDGLNSSSDSTSGGNVSDTFWGFAGSHAHPAWYFTAPGEYELTFRSTVRVGGVFVTSPDTTFTFYVDTMSGNARLTENPPLARNDAATVAEDSGVTTIDVLANDSSSADPFEVLTVTSVTQGDQGGVIAIAGGGANVTYAPAANFFGTETFTYTVTDEHGGVATATVTMTVSPFNDLPTISNISDRFVQEGNSTGTIAFTVGDVETSAGDLLVTATSSNQSVIPNGSIIFGGSGANRTIELPSTLGQAGPTFITVTVTDAGGAQSSDTFVLTVVANRTVPFSMPIYQGPSVGPSGFQSQMADFNGDGKQDMIVAGSGGNALGYRQGVGDGNFLPEQLLNAGSGLSAQGIVAVDYDGDGDMDLVAQEYVQSVANTGTITLYRNNGTASFTRVVLASGHPESYRVVAGDLNGDGRTDLVYGKALSIVAYALQQSNGELGAEMVLPVTFGSAQGVLLGDMDNDNNLDIVVSNRANGVNAYFSVFSNDGSGVFSAPQNKTTGIFPTALQLVDMNSDGRLDVVTSESVVGSRAGYYPQMSDGTFGARVVVLPTNTQLNSIRVADINGDGVPDIAAGAIVGGAFSMVWSPGLGGGAFGNTILVDPNQGNAFSIHVADLDGDSNPDIVTTGTSSETLPSALRVYINKTGENPMVLIPPAARTRVASDPIDLQVYFGFPITVTGTPRISLELGGNTVYANYLSGSGNSTLTFRYLVTATDLDLDGVQLASNLIDLNGGTLTNPIGGAGALEFPNLPFSGVIANGRGPLVQSINRLDPLSTTAGTVRFAVQFAENVTGVDAADLAVRMNAGDLAGAAVTSVTGSGSLYEVTVSTGTGSGTLGLSVIDTASIFDLSSDVLGKGYLGGEVYTVRPTPVGDIDAYYVSGHADYRPVYSNGEFSYILNPDNGLLPENEYPSDEAITYLDSTSIVNRPTETNYDFIGVGAGQPFYLSNSSGNIASVPFLGWSGESLVANDFAERLTGDPRISGSTLREYVKVQMVGFRSSSGGDFSLYSVSSGNPTVWFASSDGIGSTDNIWLYRTHFHRNTAFSKPGVYEIDVVVSGYLDSNANNALDPLIDTYVESGIKTMVFHVDTLGAIDDIYTVSAQNTLRGNVTLNDKWNDALGAMTATVVTPATEGILSLLPNGSFSYVPSPAFDGSDSFVYNLANTRGGSTTATVTITAATTPNFVTTITHDHIDIGIAYENDAWDLHVHDEENDIEYEPDEVLFVVGSAAETTRPAGAEYDFIGVAAAAPVWTLPDSENAALPFLGIGTEEILTGTFDGDVVSLELVAVDGPGHVSLWASGVTPTVLFATANGVTTADASELATADHAHFNWSFTAPGRYAITVRARGDVTSEGPSVSDLVTYYFEVNLNPVAVADSFTVSAGNAVRGNVLFNDTDADGDLLTAAEATGPTHGTLVLTANGSFTYSPGPSFAGSDSFTYTAIDALSGVSAPVTVTITAATAPTFAATISEGHADIGIAYEDDAWDLHVHDEENDVEYEPDEALIYAGNAALTTRLGGSQYDFIGVAAGASYYQIPNSEIAGVPFLGFGLEEIDDGTFAGNTVTLSLLSVNGPGQFSLWRNSGLDIAFATSDDITALDSVELPTGEHEHYNYAFTAPGRYEVTVQATGILEGETEPTTSDPVTYYFFVGPPTVTSISPFVGPTVGGTQVVIEGFGFYFDDTLTEVKFGDAVATIVSISPGQLVVSAPSGSLGTVNVTVTTPGGASADAGSSDDFTYANPLLLNVAINAGTAPISNYALSGNVVTVTTAGNTTYSVGQSILIAGMSNLANNGAFVVQTASAGTNSFTFVNDNVGAASAGFGGTVTAVGGAGSLSGAQRSMIDSIVYTFDMPVAFGANAFTVALNAGASGTPGTVPTVHYASPDGGTTWVVTFSGAGVTGNSIADGVYDITLNGSGFTSPGTLANRTDTFLRRFGDINGNGIVTGLTDFNAFKATLGLATGNPGYVAAFDFNANGNITGLGDSNPFKTRLGSPAWTGFTVTL